jgi:uncharacterized membrane protein
MSFKALYPLTGTMMLIGILAMAYGMQSMSITIFLEGIFLMWLSFSITSSVWEAQRLET